MCNAIITAWSMKKGLKIGTLKAHCYGTTFCPITHIISIEIFLIYC